MAAASLRLLDLQVEPAGALILIKSMTGWWFGTFFIFPYIGNNHPN